MTPPVDSTPMWSTRGFTGSEEDLVIAGNIIAADLTCVTPTVDSIKFGDAVVLNTAWKT